MKTIPLFVLFLFLGLSTIFAQQKLSVARETICVYDLDNKKYFALDDSSYYYIYDNKQWLKKPYVFIGDAFNFDLFIDEFVGVSIADKGILFVHKGGGLVYALKNDTIQRIDKSFKHQSQYGGGFFSNKGKLYAFGGYGIFTMKNYTIYFDDTTKEWFEVHLNNEDSIPEARASFMRQVNTDRLMILGGYLNINELPKNMSKEIWELNLKTKKWHKKGITKDTLIEKLVKFGRSNHLESEYYFYEKALYKLNLFENQYSYFVNNEYTLLRSILSNPFSDSVMILRSNSDQDNYTLTVEPKKNWKKVLLRQHRFTSQ